MSGSTSFILGMKKCICTTLLLISGYFQLVAQNQCAQSLNSARTLYSEGHFYRVPEVLQECLERGFSREQRIQAYHLLTMAYLYMDEHALAEESYLKLLQLDPEFDVENDNEHIEIVYLNNKYKTTPIFTLTAQAGVNATIPVIINPYDVSQKDPVVYEYGAGYWFGPGVDLSINDKFKVGAELLFRRTSFSYRNKRFEDDNLELKLVHNFISLPVSVKYTYQAENFYPYAYAGVMYDYLISSRGNFEYNNVTEDLGSFNVRSSGIDMTPLRNQVSLNFVGGIGLKKRIRYYYVFVEFRFIGGLKNIVDVENRYLKADNYLYDFEALFPFTYIDDDMRLNSFSFSIGFEKPFYKPRSISPRQSFFKRIFN